MPLFSQKPIHRNIAAILVTAILSTAVFNFLILPVKTAEATVPVNDSLLNTLMGSYIAEQTGFNVKELAEWGKAIGISEDTLKTIQDAKKVADASKELLGYINEIMSGILENELFKQAVATVAFLFLKELLGQVTDEINAWIMDGKTPRFVGDWNEFLKNAADQAGGKFVESLGGGFLCDALSVPLRIALATPPKFSEAARCTISDIVENIDDFYNDFTQGGWQAWMTVISEPQNNFYGMYLMAMDEKAAQMAAAVKAAEDEAIAGQGWLGTKDGDGKIKVPGSVISSQINKQIDSARQMVQDEIVALVPQMGLAGNILLPYLQSIANTLFNKVLKTGLGAVGVNSP